MELSVSSSCSQGVGITCIMRSHAHAVVYAMKMGDGCHI